MKTLSKYHHYASRLLDGLALFGVVLALIQVCYAQQTDSQEATLLKKHAKHIHQQSNVLKECTYE